MNDWIDYTQCSECGKQCQKGGHCIGGMGGKDTKCPGFIRYVPKIKVEKDVWESTLNRSMVLQAENEHLKELLKECELWFTGVVGNMNDKNVGEHNRNLPIGNFEHAFKVFSQKINQALEKIKELEK